MVWIPKEPKYKPKPPKPNNTPINTPTNTPTNVLEGGNKMTNQEAIEKLRVLKFKYPIKRGSTFDIALDMAIDALKREPIVIRCKELLSKEDFEAVVKRIHEQNQNVIVIPCGVEVVSTNASTNASTNTSTKLTNISTDVLEGGNEMTREEALEILDTIPTIGEQVDALEMAIEALEIVDWYHQNENKDMVSGANSDEHQAWYKVEDKSNKMCLFSEIKQGEAFLDFEDDVAIKTSTIETSDVLFNAIYLDDGSIAYLRDGEEVRRINAKVVIE